MALFEDGELAEHPDHIIQRAFDAYNAAAIGAGWPQTTNLTDSRRKRLKAAIRDCGGLAGWEMAMARAAKSGFLTGKVKTLRAPVGFLAKLDFFLRSDRRTSLLDGEYDDKAPAAVRSVLDRVRAMPNAPPPKELPFVPEPEEVRLAAMIATFRKLDRWADANEVEKRLAKLEGRPAVLVPAPDVARYGMPERPPEPPRRPAPIITDVPDWDGVPEGTDYGSE